MTLVLLGKLWGFLKSLPWWVYVIAAAVIYHIAAIHVAASRATDECNAKWQAKVAEQAKENAAAVAALDAKYRKIEQEESAQVAKIGADYAQKLADATEQRKKDVAAARAGAIKLRIPPGNADNGTAAQASSGPTGSDGPARGELPPEIAGDLLALADDADQVAKQLAACQAIVAADRAIAP